MTSIISSLYTLLVEPIEYIIETSFCLFRNYFSGQVAIPIAIAAVSLLVNILTFPIYSAADAKQLEEREIRKKLEKGIAHIKSAFKGDERFMILATYYKLNNYSPIYALRGSLSILIQVPFFIAAYHFLSKCPELSGVRLGPIADLMKPDSLIRIGSLSINVLPILMTAINVVSGTIYTRGGASIRERIQVYGLAMIFLVLLYGSPSGLVFYWILNQVFSLLKNVIMQSKHPRRIAKLILCSALVAFCLYSVLFKPNGRLSKKLIITIFTATVCLFFLQAKRIAPLTKKLKDLVSCFAFNKSFGKKQYNKLFSASCIGLFLLVGSVIPLSVLASDVAAFSFLEGYSSPFLLYRHILFKAAGLFILWPAFIYGLSADRYKPLLSALFALLLFSALLNFYLFSPNYGILSDILVYEKDDIFHAQRWYTGLNALAIILIALLVYLLFCKKAIKLMFMMALVVCVSVTGHSLVQANSVMKDFKRFSSTMRRDKDDSQIGDLKPILSISKTGKNVFCIMLDRATGAYLEECFAEDSRLYEQYDGFTFYPNTVSFSYGTLAGAPGLFGGYEYVPAMMNLKDEVPMADKLEEATSVLPRIFARNGYSSLMTDMPLQWFLDENFDMGKYPEQITTVETQGAYWLRWKTEHGFGDSIQLETDKKRFLPYSILRSAPVFVRSKIYNEGSYLISYYELDQAEVSALPGGGGALDQTIKNYSVLDYLPALTKISDAGDNFTFMVNDLTHCPNVLQLPDYVPAPTVTQYSPSKYATDDHYYVNMAALKLLGKWLDYLRENDAYDNTRIIISSDHGSGVGVKSLEAYSHLPRGELTCLLLVKDFDSKGRLNIDDTFMTNADVPSIAVKGLIDNPINPATGNDITKLSLKNPVYGEYTEWQKAFKNKHSNTLTVDEDTWYSIHDDLFDMNNWEKPSSDEVYANTLENLRKQGVELENEK
ncbi:MAG: YidC/Oxa1 family membrane protein insertase [Treponema sp.]|nr:YidC/Oxa1 family membrane protein insertase [Treponema sp.]